METIYRMAAILIQITPLLPIREAYEWKLFKAKLRSSVKTIFLLPIREAYEWKPVAGGWFDPLFATLASNS